MKNKLAIFDMDGTLFDTNKVNFKAYQKALEENCIHLEKGFFLKECTSRHYSYFLPLLGVRDSSTMKLIHNRKKAIYRTMLHYACENSQLFDIAEGLRRDYYLAIVTTASKMNTMDILQYFNRETFFDLIITQEEITKTKPDPEGFVLAMKHFNVSPKNTLIFEDSEIGLIAAENSGASVYCVKKFAKGD